MIKNLVLLLLAAMPTAMWAQVFWTENFNDAAANTRWRLEATPGSRSNPTPTGIPGLTYNPGTANQGCHNYWVINNYHTPNTTPTGSGFTVNCPTGIAAGNRSLHITFPRLRDCYEGSGFVAPTDFQVQNMTGTIDHSISDAYLWGTFGHDVSNDAILSATDQFAFMTSGISTIGRCNLVLRFVAYFGGDADGNLDAPFFSPLTDRSVLYSIDGGTTWRTLVPDIFFNRNTSGQCKPWDSVAIALPADCDNRADVRFAFRWRNAMDPNENGLSGSRFSSFNVDNLSLEQAPAPTVNFDAPLSTTVCRTEVVTLRDLSNTFGATPTYSWSISPATFSYVNGTTANSKSPEVTFTAAGNYSITLTLSNSCGLSVPLTRTNYITVNLCTPNTNFYSNLQEVCATTPAPVSGSLTQVVFTNNSNSFLPITAYSWNFGAGASPATATGPGPHTVTYTSAGTKTVTLTATNADGNRTETKTAYILAKDCKCNTGGSGTGTEVEIYKETFTSGLNGWSGYTTGTNRWITLSTQTCSFPASPPSNMSQPAGITNPNTNYMFVQANFFGVVGPCHYATDPGAARTITSPQINATGKSDVSISFWYRMGSSGNASVQVSVTGTGGPWTTINLPQNNATGWQQRTLTAADVPGMNNAADIRIRFSWTYVSGMNTYPTLCVDDVIVKGTDGGGGGGADGIFTCPVSGPLCAGQAVTVPFNTQGTFNTGNVFTAQLSNASGSFAAPTNIGTLALSGSNLTGQTISATIPAGTPLGTGYRIRVSSSNPIMSNLNDNGENIAVIDRPLSQTISGAANVCVGAAGQVYSVPLAPVGHSFSWTISGTAAGTLTSGQGTRQAAITWTGPGTATLTLRETNSCGFRDHTFTVNVLPDAPASQPISGPSEICLNAPTGTYTVPASTGATYTWSVTNGTITGGQGTTSVNVTWAGAGPGEVRVVVANPCGTASPTQVLGVNVTTAMTASMQINGPSTLLVAEAATPRSYFVGFQPGITYTWSISPAGRGTILSGQGTNGVSIQWNASLGSATLSVTATPGGSCPVVSNDTLVYIINPTSIHSVAVPTEACQGSSINLTFATSGGAFDAGNRFFAVYTQDTTQWVESFGGQITLSGSNLSAPAATIPVAIPAGLAPGKYYFRVRSSRPALTSVAPNKLDSLIVVATPPQGTLTSTPATLCQGEPVDFSFTGAVAGISYTLQRGGVALAGPTVATGSTVNFDDVAQAPGTAVYRVVADRIPCPTTVVSADVSVTVNVPPVTTYTLTPSTGTLCPGGSLTLTLSGSDSGVSYQLLANGSPVGTAQTGTGAALNFSPPTPAVGTTTYSVEATRTACAVATLGSADVTRVADPVNGTLSASATTLCVGTSLDLSFAGATVGATYILQRDGADLAGPTVAAGTTVAFNGISQSAGTANYQVMQVLTGCPITLASNVVYVAAVASPLATFGLTANRNQLCPGEVLSLSLSGSETGVAYQLLANGNPVGASQNGTGAALTFSPTPVAGATTYSVRATRTGCPPITMGNAVVNATLTLPTPGFFVTPSPAELGAPATITPTIGGPAPDAVTYLIEPGSTLLTAVPPTAPVQHVFSTDGTFTITQTVQIGNCTATLSLPLQVISGLLLIIPNAFSPNNDGLNDRVEFALTAVQRFSFQVFNRWGEKVFETNNPVSFWDGRLNGQDLPEGAYVYRLEVVDLAGRTQNRSGSIMLVR